MKETKCDFCGKIIETHGNGFKGVKLILIENEGYANANTQHLDLCPEHGKAVKANLEAGLNLRRSLQ